MTLLAKVKPGTWATLEDGRRAQVVGRIAGAALVRFGTEGPREGPFALDPAATGTDLEEPSYLPLAAARGDEVDPLRPVEDEDDLLAARGNRSA